MIPISPKTKRPTRTAFATFATALLATVIAACGTGETVDTPDASTEVDADAFPVEIEHKFGTTVIEEPPERVVSVGYGEDDTAISLGVTPVGIREFIGDYAGAERPWAKEQLEAADPEEIGAEGINFEQVKRLDPDVILGVYSLMTERDYETLSKFAPTIAQPDEFVDGGVPWQDQTRIDGEALGRSTLAEELIADTEAKFEETREANPDFEGKTALLGVIDGGTVYAYASQDPRQRFFLDLGFEMPEQIDEDADGRFYAEYSKEEIDKLDQDVLILLESTDKQEEIEADPIYQSLDVAQRNSVVFVDADDEFAGALGFNSPISLPVAIDDITEHLQAAADDDPETVPGDVE